MVQPSALGTFHQQQKFRFEISEISHAKWNGSLQKLNPKIAYIPFAQTWPKPMHVWLLFLHARYKRVVLGTSTLSNEKGHFGSTIWYDQTSQSGPPLKLVLNIPVGPNWNGSFHDFYYDVPTEISGILGWMESALCFHFYPLWFTLTHVISKLSNLKGRGGFLKPTIKSKTLLMIGFLQPQKAGVADISHITPKHNNQAKKGLLNK